MKIGLDISQTAFPGTGVARYTENLALGLIQHAGKKHEFVFLFNSLRKSPPPSVLNAIKPPHTIKHYRLPPTFLSFLWNDIHIFPVEKLIGKLDVYISSDWLQPPVRSARSITIVHDLIVYRFP